MTLGTELDTIATHRGGLDLANAGRGVAAAADSSLVVEWAQRLTVVARAVDLVVETPFVPAAYWPLPKGVKLRDFPSPWLVHPSEDAEGYKHRRRIAGATATLAALHGERYGWSPEQSWRALYVVSGRVGIGYEGVVALLRGAGFTVDVLERSATRAAVAIGRPGRPPVTYEFTMDDAEQAGYVPGKGPLKGKEYGGNPKYNTDPKTMLLARALTIGARIEAADVVAGMPVAELINDEPVEADPAPARVAVSAYVETAAAAAGTSSDTLRAALAASTPAPAADPDALPPHDPATGELLDPPADELHLPATDRTKRAIGERFGELGVGGRGSVAARLWLVRQIARDPLVTLDTITEGTAARVLARLRDADRAGVVALLDQRPGPDLDDREQSDAPADPQEVDRGDA